MKTKILAVVLLLFVTHLWAKDKPLRYNLNVGDEFFYKLSSQIITKSDLSVSEEHVANQVHWLKFEVLSSSEDNYHLSLEFTRIRTDNQHKTFDTQKFCLPKGGKEKIAQHIIGKKLFFSLNEKGKLSGLEISNKLREQLFRDANIKGILNKQDVLKYSLLNPHLLRETIRSVFPEFPEKNELEWTISSQGNMQKAKYETHFERLNNDKQSVNISFNSRSTNQDTLQKSFQHQVILLSSIASGRMYLDTQSSLLIKSNSYHKISIKEFFREKVNGEFKFITQKREIRISVDKIASPNSSSTVIITGEIEPDVKIDSIRFFIWNNFPDKYIFRHTLKKDNNNRFYLKTKLPREMEVTHNHKLSTFVTQYNNLLLEPGDSIHFRITSDYKMLFSGKGSFKINLANKIRSLREPILVDFEPERALETALNNIEKKFAVIDQRKDSLSDWAIKHLKTGAYFSEYENLQDYYYRKNNSCVNSQMFSILFSGIDFNKYTSSTSLAFRRFIKKYIFRKQLILHGYKNNRHSPIPESYMLAKMLLTGEFRYYACADYLSEALGTSEKTNYESIYQDFQECYAGTEYAETLQYLYENRVDLSIGALAPNFKLKSLDGVDVSLSDFKGKWVMISFCEINVGSHKRDVLAFQEMKKALSSDNFELLIAFSQINREETKAFLRENKIKGVLLDNHNWEDKNAIKYKIEGRSRNFLINPKGEIEFSGTGSPRDHFIQLFIDYIKETSQNKTSQALISREALLRLLGAFFLFITLFVGIYKWRIYIIKKREKQERERVELELQAVRSQLNPHFLFNSMNSIQHLVNSEDNEKANIFLSKFGSLMRKVLVQSELKLIPLKDELETIETYLELEALRHQFSYHIKADKDIDLYTIEVPPMLLQPFVENAIVHGIYGIKEGDIAVNITKNDQMIIIRIIDNGNGFDHPPNAQSTGKGLEITQRRVDLMKKHFKNEITFNLSNRIEYDPKQTGVIAQIKFNLEN